MKKLATLFVTLLALAVPATASADLSHNEISLSGQIQPGNDTVTGISHVYYECNSPLTIPAGQTRYFKAYYWNPSQGYVSSVGTFVGPYHIHGFSTSGATGPNTYHFDTAQIATHNGYDERYAMGIRWVGFGIDQYGIQHGSVWKVVNQSTNGASVLFWRCTGQS